MEDKSVLIKNSKLTVGHLISILETYPIDTPVAVSHDGLTSEPNVLDIDAIFDNRRYGNDNEMCIINFISEE